VPLLLPLLLLPGCGGASKKAAAEEGYAGSTGTEVHLAPPDAPEETLLLLRIEAAAWTLRQGERWADAEELARYALQTDDGLWVDASHLLPAEVAAGATGEGVEVLSLGARETWYGGFEDVATVRVDEGPFAGEAAFARGVGPIALTHGGALWELVWYR
jgi:hypothetical protein